jgi:oligopeptide transport system ATP-binding protein
MSPSPASPPLLSVRNLVKHYPPRTRSRRSADGTVHAVCDVSFELEAGETLGLVGESGSGKSTIGRTLLHLVPPTAGTVEVRGRDIGSLRGTDLRELRRELQIVFQDPYASLDPRMTAEQIIAEPLRIHGNGSVGPSRDRVPELMELVGLDPSSLDRAPAAFSGG